MVRASLVSGSRRFPTGAYEIEDAIADDGVTVGRPVKLACSVTIDRSQHDR